MCWGSEMQQKVFDPLYSILKQRAYGSAPTAPSTPTTATTPSTPSTPASADGSSDLMKRLILANTGAVTNQFGQRVREAGLGTSITPKSVGAVKDPTRQS